jgi:glycerol-3-phosphate acyltransferase PlsY
MNRRLNPALFSLTALPLLAAASISVYLTLGQAPALYRYAAVLPLAYLIGSIPWGYLLLNWARGEDVRDYGSGRTGMTNVLRTGGRRMAALVLLLDFGKGVAVALLARSVLDSTIGEVCGGVLALAGHNWPVFLGFRGGRGILTALGGLSMMTPVPALVATVIFLLTAFGSRYISLGSIVGVLAGAASLVGLALAGWYSTTYMLFAGAAAAMIIWQHRDNIQRLIQGNERRMGTPAAPLE